MADWVTREDPEPLALAPVRVREYERRDPRTGRPEMVHSYQAQRSWWIPHPDWEKGQQEWVTAGERDWKARGQAAEAKDKAARGSGKGDAGPEHGYERPDPARLHRERGTYKKPEDHPFFKRNPMSAQNVVDAYDGSTPSEKHQGARWYEDGHRVAWALGGGDAAKGAGVLSAYSPQTSWPVNMFNAARSLAEGRAYGPGEAMATGAMQKTAQKIIDGVHPDEALPSPKTNAFGRLLALGRDHPDDALGQVVVDRHAMSVAAGRRLMKEDVSGKGEFASPIGKDPFYSHVADMYREAARMISERDGEEISPHQVQAITWLRQQRVNTEEDLAGRGAGAGKGLVTGIRNAWGRWQDYAREHGLRTELGTTALPPTPITAAEARGNSRPVAASEFYQVATRGRDLLQAMESSRSPADGLAGNWDNLASQAWEAVQQSWGGVTIDPHTGETLPDGADKYAVSVKPPGTETISLPETTTEAEFLKAFDRAAEKFGPLLEQDKYHLGIFHDDEHNRIDIDPVVVVDSQSDAEAIGAYTHNVGGAYHFASGDGFWPPHIADE